MAPFRNLFGARDTPAENEAGDRHPQRAVREVMPLEVRRPFFGEHERLLYEGLERVLGRSSYRVFPNVRLRDFLRSTSDSQRTAIYARLRDQHADFLIVEALGGYRPVLAIELDGRVHEQPAVQALDDIKETALRSAGLELLRLSSREYADDELRSALEGYDLTLSPAPIAPSLSSLGFPPITVGKGPREAPPALSKQTRHEPGLLSDEWDL